MLIELISRYYKFLWFALIAFAFFKVFFSYAFLDIEGINGALYSLIKWFGEDDQELEDYAPRRSMMRFLNLLTITIYAVIIFIAVASLLLMILPR